MIEQEESIQKLEPAAIERKKCIHQIRSQLKIAIAISHQQKFQLLEYMLKMADMEAELLLEEPLKVMHETSNAQMH